MNTNIQNMTNKELEEALIKYNALYRQGTPEISDVEYDAMVDRLMFLDPNNPWFEKLEPGVVGDGRKVKLPIPMKSLNKVKSIADVQSWLKNMSIPDQTLIIITPKFDGLSLLYSYPRGQAYSRGGVENEGQDCTAHYNILSHPTMPSNRLWDCVFGEFVFNRKNWETYFAGQVSPETGDKYKSPRNTAAGFLNRDTPSELIKHIDFYRYGIDTYSLQNFNTYLEVLQTLCTTFHQDNLYAVMEVKELSEERLHEIFKQFSERYYIDGLVLYINDLYLWDVIGRHQTTGNPLYAMAYKHPDFTDCFETTVKGINWKVSKSGALKPVVNIEMVDTGDCNMENPTGYNAAWINEHQIAPGAKILVTRSGGVIPKILNTLQPATQEAQEELWDGLCECPHCGAPTAWNDTHVELCCTNPKCCGINLAEITFFYLTCGAEGVGEETLAKIFNAGYNSISRLLSITFDELMAIDGFGESISNTILENNRKIKKGVDIVTLMHASNCFAGIGKIKAQKILENMDPDMLQDFYDMTYDPLPPDDEVYGMLSKTQQAFEDGVTPFYNFIASIGVPVIKIQNAVVDTNGKYAGMAVCFSGVRDSELESLIVAQGGKVASGVSKNTTHLVVKDPSATSSKITKAKGLGIPILSIDEFVTLN